MRRIYNVPIVFSVFGFCIMLFCGMISMSAVAQQKNNPEGMTITNQEKTLTVYPVPVKTTVHVRISPALRPDIDKLEIISLIGRKITEQSIIDPNTTDVSFSNLNQYPSGIYMIIARDKYGKIVKSAKMIIDK